MQENIKLIKLLTNRIEEVGYATFLKTVGVWDFALVMYLFDKKTEAKINNALTDRARVTLKDKVKNAREINSNEITEILQTALDVLKTRRTSHIRLKLKLYKGIPSKIFMILLMSFFTYAFLIGERGEMSSNNEIILIVLLFVFIGVAFISLYQLIKVLRVRRELHISADINTLEWYIFDNDTLIKSVKILKRELKDFQTYKTYSFGHYTSTCFVFSLKDESSITLDDMGLYSFDSYSDEIKDFLELWYHN